ncbi:MAG TPA: heme exporter protein CcmB [Candidatus Acidoferrales bacterium]|nr:heme exporter protein CcmB [Candidatus Acidoferrales bacterium]
MGTARAAAIVLGREIRAEMRTRELLQTTIVFTIIVVVLFNFAFEPSVADARRIGPGLIWIALLFAGSLMLNPSFAKEQSNDTIYALRMAPVSSFAIVLGKTLANLLFLSITEMVLVPVFSILYNVPVLAVIGRLAMVLLLGTFGMVVVGTVFSALATQARLRELLLPLLLLPVLIPLLFASVEATVGLLGDAPALDRTWMAVLIAFDVVFFTASWLLCDHLLEE